MTASIVELQLLQFVTVVQARRVMFDNIKEICFTSKLKGQCMITESLLLADPQVNSISKSVNRNIKEQLFEYLASVDRRLRSYLR